eukprot:TRINITY_DN5314_c0_g2_i3.p2 TRINITY_DN5314_c0_g2~~TRINITY_DN5314_c0_g2_i3.p2  ORF type:complete len:113 (-),score=9.09 TRINITY_DN5314_c0_g2_i3:80-418(-)
MMIHNGQHIGQYLDFFTVIEHTIHYFFSWIFVIKYFFILWLMSPVGNGAQVLYAVVIAPIWSKIPSLPTNTKPVASKVKEHKSDDEDESEEDEQIYFSSFTSYSYCFNETTT